MRQATVVPEHARGSSRGAAIVHQRALRGTSLFVTALWLIPTSAAAGVVVINNGLAPPEPANRIDAGNSYPSDSVYVQNLGCDVTLESDSCELEEAWGDPTIVEVVDGGEVGLDLVTFQSSALSVRGGVVSRFLSSFDASTVTMTAGSVTGNVEVWDDSTFAMSGGTADRVTGIFNATLVLTGGSVVANVILDGSSSVTIDGAYVGGRLIAFEDSSATLSSGCVDGALGALDSSTVHVSGGAIANLLDASGSSIVRISGGEVGGSLQARDDSRVTLTGGSVGGDIEAFDAAGITIVGSGFAVDGLPVTEGPVQAGAGVLTGTLASGDPIDNAFCHAGCKPGATGEITLVPEIALNLQRAIVGVALAVLRRRERTWSRGQPN